MTRLPPIECISEPRNSSDPAIIFIHGLDGHPRNTWMLDSNDENSLWPKWLAEDYNCSVFLVAYDAASSKWKEGAMPLPDQGDSILAVLSSEPKLKDRPLIMVGHSMGGLVIKTLIQSGLNQSVKSHREIVNHIRGIVFVGTPHNGSQLAKLASAASLFWRTNTQVKNMQTHDAHLRALNRHFLGYYNEPPQGKVSVRSFTETQGVFKGIRIFGCRIGPTVTIVDPNDADAHVPSEAPVPLAEDHISMCKLANKEQLLYKSLLVFLQNEVVLSLPKDEVNQVESGDTINMTAGKNSIVVKEINAPFTMNNNR